MLARLSTLRAGNADILLTEEVQGFLRGLDLYMGPIDGLFGPKTAAAVRAYQKRKELHADGVVGNRTWGALMADGLTMLTSTDSSDERSGANWPPPPLGMRTLTNAQRAAIFGAFDFESAASAKNPEAIKITRKDSKYKIAEVSLPELIGCVGFPSSGTVLFHARAADQLKRLINAWAAADLLRLVRSWGGTLDQRFVRGSKSTLSSHAWGSALDINVAWNWLGAQPALVGREGSVRELVGLANELGFYWGGHFKRPDGMHFEVVQTL